MSDKDFAVSSVSGVPTAGIINKKPSHLIFLEEGNGKSFTIKRFISLDKPDLLPGFIQVKGIFCELSEEEIIKNFADILTKTPKELILDVMFPFHKIVSIRNLVFNANKLQTLAK